MNEIRKGSTELQPSPVETKDKVGSEIQHSNIFFRLSTNRFKSVSSDGVELHRGEDPLASLTILVLLKDLVEM